MAGNPLAPRTGKPFEKIGLLKHYIALALLWFVLNCHQQQALKAGAQAALFTKDFHHSWGQENIKVMQSGQTVQLALDGNSGCGFASNNQYLYGYFGMQMKLVPGNSAGTVTAFYLSSKINKRDAHDEIDFEFLGNVSGEPYILQTNVYTGGVGGREQRIYLWFDPTTDYHWYSIVWNRDAIVFWVDAVPIRSFKNNTDLGVPYLSGRPMKMYSSLFDASGWATRGGLVGVNWSHAPFVTTYTGFTVMGCKVDDNVDYVNSSDPPCHFTLSATPWHGNNQHYHHQDTVPNDIFIADRSSQQQQRHIVANSSFVSDHISESQQNPHPLQRWIQANSTRFDSQNSKAPQHRNPLIRLVQDEIFIYDYCNDSRRYPSQPLECSRNEQLLNSSVTVLS